jgi:hypothetical protein
VVGGDGNVEFLALLVRGTATADPESLVDAALEARA